MTLLFVFGPPAVGKMTVGRAIADASDFRLFHNHHVLEPLLDVFDYGTPPFNRLLEEFRLRVLEEAATSGTDLVYTLVWALDLPEDSAYLRRHLRPFVDAGQAIAFVELYAGLETRLARNRTPYRLAEKKSKRDLEWSDDNVRDLDRHVLSTGVRPTPADELIAAYPHLRIDNTCRSAEDVATEALAWLERLTFAS
ncbi:MAG TPA: AAA family ATPase [Nocardioides sp.]|nr:AAA family ATPase [Nocardioides sp.]